MILETNYKVTGMMTHNILLSRVKGQKTYFNLDGVPKDPDRRCHAQEEEGRMTPTLTPFVRSDSLHSSNFYRMLCGPSVFYRI